LGAAFLRALVRRNRKAVALKIRRRSAVFLPGPVRLKQCFLGSRTVVEGVRTEPVVRLTGCGILDGIPVEKAQRMVVVIRGNTPADGMENCPAVPCDGIEGAAGAVVAPLLRGAVQIAAERKAPGVPDLTVATESLVTARCVAAQKDGIHAVVVVPLFRGVVLLAGLPVGKT
jgi:hypothetical protein